MLSPKELRIGNVLLFERKTDYGSYEVVVTEIEQDGFYAVGDEVYPLNDEMDQVRGMLLTPEWMERLGFKSSKASPFCRIILPSGIGELAVNPDNGTVWIHKNGNACNPASIKYVHQLQNLFFGLTGEDLEITPSSVGSSSAEPQ